MTEQPPNPILTVVQQFRKALENHDKQSLNRLINAYGRMYERLQDKINLLVDAIGMDEPTTGQLIRMRRYKELIAQVEEELTGFQVILRNEIGDVSRDAITFAGRDSARMLNTIGAQYGVNINFNRLPTATIETLLGFLGADSPLYERIGKLAGVNAQIVADKIVEGVGLGYNPRKIAAVIRDSLGGGLTDALRMTRTVQLWSYREATRANYINNADAVEGWVWWAHLEGNPCMACIAQHGSFHTLDETLDDHHNGRCAMIPVVRGFPAIVEGNGQEWFEQQPEAKQRELMGKGKFEAWKEGKFQFGQLAAKHTDDVYGQMTVEETLKGLIGE